MILFSGHLIMGEENWIVKARDSPEESNPFFLRDEETRLNEMKYLAYGHTTS